MAKKGAVPSWFNSFVKFALRSPLHFLFSNKIMLLSLAGRKTGKLYTIPVSYTQQDNTLVVFTNMPWSKNLVDNTPVTLRLRGEVYKATTESVTEDPAEIAPVLGQHLVDKPVDARIHKVSYDSKGEPMASEVQAAANQVKMFRFRLL